MNAWISQNSESNSSKEELPYLKILRNIPLIKAYSQQKYFFIFFLHNERIFSLAVCLHEEKF